jgi:hypothetical protein
MISFTETIIWKQEIAPLIVYNLHQIKVYLPVEFKKKEKTQVTTNKFNQLTITISKSLLAMILQDNTSSINCMQQLQLNLT